MEYGDHPSPAVTHLLGLIGDTPIMIDERLTTIEEAYNDGLLDEQCFRREALHALQKLGKPSDGSSPQLPSSSSVPPFISEL